MEDMELICFKIISSVGGAKSEYISAISYAKKGEFAKAEELIKHGDECALEGHKAHAELIRKEASGSKVEISLLLMHAEDQLLGAETIKLFAEEFIDLYKKMECKEWICQFCEKIANNFKILDIISDIVGALDKYNYHQFNDYIEIDMINVFEKIAIIKRGGGDMKKFYLFCDNGMSTSLMASRMQKVAEANNLPIEVKAFGQKDLDMMVEEGNIDVIILGPQVKHLYEKVNEKYGKNYVVYVIDQQDYGNMDGERTLKKALKLYKEFQAANLVPNK